MSSNKIPYDDLIEIFNNVLNSYPFYIDVPALSFILSESKNYSYREEKSFKQYLNEKLTDIEFKFDVFESIPPNHIYMVVQDFIEVLADYNRACIYKKKNTKKLQKESYNLRQKDIKIIEAYQEMIFDYTSDNGWNDNEYSILNPVLNDVYQLNKLLLEELETKEYKTLDVFRYGGTILYDSTKKPLRHFFNNLRKKYPMKTDSIKQMIDIL